jgi:thiol-disulfide isomerase/thioredoxin
MRLSRVVVAILALAGVIATAGTSVLVQRVQLRAMSGDVNGARQDLTHFRNAAGTTPEYIEALSWLGRGQLATKNYKDAEETSAQVRKLCLDRLTSRKLDSDPHLAVALGASIEVQAQAVALQGRRDEAVVFLRQEVKRWHDTSIRPRIQKNLNLLTLEGKPAPPLEITHSLTGGKLQTLAQQVGHPVLLFFWAHWCSDCKQEIAIVQRLQKTYGPRGLVVIAPTQHYGYVADGIDAPREIETRYMAAVFSHYYGGLGPVQAPVSEENFSNYGVSTTPTLVLIDSGGIVRLYNPGVLGWEQLSAAVAAVTRKN